MPNHNARPETSPADKPTTNPTPIGWLTVRPQFLAVGKGRRLHTPRMTMQYRAQDPVAGDAAPTTSMPRFGLTVTKKTGNSVERNRIKRRLRSALRLAPLDGSVANDYVLVARRDCLAAPFEQLIADIVESCAKAVAKSAPATHLPPRPDSRS
jgi:ribonuclease P protein component